MSLHMEGTILVTGGCGFIGSHFVAHVLKLYPKCQVINLDALTYAAHPETQTYLAGIAPDRYRFVQMDINDLRIGDLLEEQPVSAIVNFAAESHVDRSILDPRTFVLTNVAGTQNLLFHARKYPQLRFLQISTDEVYGSLMPGEATFTESSPLDASSPYAASKASADLIALAAFRTFGQNVVVTRCSNNFGPFQFPEKLIPLVIANALENQPIPVYGDGKQVRDWLYVEDHCTAVMEVLKRGQAGRVYNIGGQEEHPNIETICRILDVLEKPHSLITFVNDRPGHDRRYGIDASRITNELGWKKQRTFDAALVQTVEWYLENKDWWQKLRAGEYEQFYQDNYASKFVPSLGRNV